MSMFDFLFKPDTTTEEFKLQSKIIELIDDLASEVIKQRIAVADLKQQVEIHRTAIQELYYRNNILMKAVRGSSIDVQMPSLVKDVPSKPS